MGGHGGVDQLAVVGLNPASQVNQHADEAERDGDEEDPMEAELALQLGTVGKQTPTGSEIASSRAPQRTWCRQSRQGIPKIVRRKHHIQHDVIKNNVAGGITHAINNFR